jgi:hypothetical protein
MTNDQPSLPSDLNAEALDAFRTLVAGADSLPEAWRTTILGLVQDGMPGTLAPLESLIASTRGEG